MSPTDGLISHRGARVLFRQRRGERQLCIRENDTLRWLHFGPRDVQAVLDPRAPARLVAPYANAMIAALLFRPAPRRLLNLGIGGGGFERFFAHHFPGLPVSSVERDPQVIALARSHFQLPPRQPVVLDSADRFLHRHRQAYDLIFCDIHEGDRHPAFLLEAGFLDDVHRCLDPAGVFALNLLPDRYETLLQAVLRLRERFPWVWLAEVPERRNRVLFGLKAPPGTDRQRRARARAMHRSCGVDLPALLPRLSEIGRPAGNDRLRVDD